MTGITMAMATATRMVAAIIHLRSFLRRSRIHESGQSPDRVDEYEFGAGPQSWGWTGLAPGLQRLFKRMRMTPWAPRLPYPEVEPASFKTWMF